MYRTLVINTDSDIKNNINCFHLIKNSIILWTKNTSLISETAILKASEKMGNNFFNSRKLYLNLKIDLNLFLEIFNALITSSIAASTRRHLSPTRLIQFSKNFKI
jgi:hypothetical protein